MTLPSISSNDANQEERPPPYWEKCWDDPTRPGRGYMAWFFLILAGLLEVVWAYFMKQSKGFTLLVPSIITLISMIASFGLLSVSMRTLPLGTAYTIWTGIGAIGAFIVGVSLLGESITFTRLLAALLILAGLVLMKLSSNQ